MSDCARCRLVPCLCAYAPPPTEGLREVVRVASREIFERARAFAIDPRLNHCRKCSGTGKRVYRSCIGVGPTKECDACGGTGMDTTDGISQGYATYKIPERDPSKAFAASMYLDPTGKAFPEFEHDGMAIETHNRSYLELGPWCPWSPELAHKCPHCRCWVVPQTFGAGAWCPECKRLSTWINWSYNSIRHG